MVPPMNRQATEQGILVAAIDAIHREVGLQLEIVECEAKAGDKHISAIIQVPGARVCLAAEVKKWTAHASLGAVINHINQIAEPGCGMLVADYVNPKMGEELKKAGIQFIDAVGNAYINQRPTYVYMKGNKPAPEAQAKYRAKTGRAFHPAGMKVVLAFLRDRELINARYRNIAEKAQVALGAVGPVIKDLIAQGLVLQGTVLQGMKKNQRQLADFDRLLDKWVEVYPHKLKEKYKIGTFTTDDPDWWKAINPEKFNALWGGEVAAYKYTTYLTPKNAAVYINKADMAKFLRAARLRKPGPYEHPEVQVDLIEPFWDITPVNEEKKDLAPPIITYADLLETADPRNLDTANRIREKYID